MWFTKETLERFVRFISTTEVFEIPLMQRCLSWNQRGIVLLLLLLLVLLLLSAFLLLPLLWCVMVFALIVQLLLWFFFWAVDVAICLVGCWFLASGHHVAAAGLFCALLLWSLLLQHEVTSPTLISLKKMTMTYTFFSSSSLLLILSVFLC